MSELAPAVWPAHARRAEDGAISIAGVSVRDLAAEFGTPLMVFDEDDFRGRCRGMREAFGDDAAVHYASKAFLSLEIARWVRDEGLNLDVCSGGELAIALRAEFPAERIALHGNNKSAYELAYAVDSGIGHIVVDSLSEIARLDAIAGERGVVQDVLVRVTPGVQAHTHEFISTAHEDQKFGFSLTANGADSPAMTAVTAVFGADHIRLVGLHSHIGSQIFDVDGFEIAARRVLELLADVVHRFGAEKTAQLDTIDLGGGLGISYTAHDDPPPVADLAAKLRTIAETEAAALGLPTPHLAVEPGRAIAGPPGITLYEVGTIKDVALDGSSGDAAAAQGFRRYVSVDGGMSDNIRTALYGAEYTAVVASRDPDGAPVVSRIVGKHCETGDIVVRDTETPAGLNEGDLLAVAATGAYCYSMSSRYNGQPRPAVVAVKDGAARLILRRETVDDLVSLEVL